MPQQDTITIFEVVERKAVTERDPRFYRFTMIERVPPIFTTDGDMLAEFPHTRKIGYIDIPVRRFVRYGDDDHPEEKFVAMSPEAMEIFDAAFSEERQKTQASLTAYREAHAKALSRINEFNSLPLIKRILCAIRKDI